MTLSPSFRPRRCKVCREPFTKVRSIQPTCDKFACNVVYAEQVAAKAKAKRVRETKQRDAARKRELRPRKWWAAKAKKSLHAYIRARDEGKCCISCDVILLRRGRVGGDYDAGHFRSVGSAKHLEFEENNIHGQCKHCNDYLAGNPVGYERGLIARYGVAYVEALKADQRPRRLTITDYQGIEAIYDAELKALTQERES